MYKHFDFIVIDIKNLQKMYQCGQFLSVDFSSYYSYQNKSEML